MECAGQRRLPLNLDQNDPHPVPSVAHGDQEGGERSCPELAGLVPEHGTSAWVVYVTRAEQLLRGEQTPSGSAENGNT